MIKSGEAKYLKNLSWMSLEKFVRIFSGVFIGLWVSRYLKPEAYGALSYALSVSSLLINLMALGLESIVVRELVYQENRRNSIVINALTLRLFSSVIILSLVLMLSPFFSKDETITLMIFTLTFQGFFHSFFVLDWFFQSQARFKFVAISNIVGLFIGGALKIYFISVKASVYYFTLAYLMEASAVAVMLYIYFYRDEHRLILKEISTKMSSSLIINSFPLILASLITLVYMRSDQIMLKWYLGNYDVGIYSASVRLSQMFYLSL